MRRITLFATLIALLALSGVAIAQEYDPNLPGGYDPSGGGTGGYDDGGGSGSGSDGKVTLKLTAKKKQKSLKAVKVKATCEGRACTVDAKGKLKAGKKKAKLKP